MWYNAQNCILIVRLLVLPMLVLGVRQIFKTDVKGAGVITPTSKPILVVHCSVHRKPNTEISTVMDHVQKKN